MKSEVSIDSFSNFRTELRLENKLDLNDAHNNDQYSATGILPIHGFNIFLTFNFDNKEIYVYELNYS